MAAVPICKLKLFVDKDKGRVVLAEAGKDFIDVLLSFLALPLGTISKLLLLGKDEETERTPLGCFLNLYRSVQCLPEEDFYNKSRKLLLEHPIYRKFDSCRKLMRKIDNGSKGLVKYYACPSGSAACSCSYSFTLGTGTSNSPCLFCGTKMDKEVKEEDVPISEIFVSPKKSFILTDDMRVEVSRPTFSLSELSRLGYENLLKLEKEEVDVTSKEVLALLHCLFTSKTPLSDVFIEKKKKQSVGHDIIPRGVPGETEDKSESQESEPVSLNVLVSKKTGGVKIRCSESKEAFVDIVCLFLAVPIEIMWEITGNRLGVGSIDNLCSSLKALTSTENAYSLPAEYGFMSTSILGTCLFPNKEVKAKTTKQLDVTSGFVKKSATYWIKDDLTISAANSSSNLDMLTDLDVDMRDFKWHQISISKKQALDLLLLSLTTSQPLTAALGGLIP